MSLQFLKNTFSGFLIRPNKINFGLVKLFVNVNLLTLGITEPLALQNLIESIT